MTEYSMYDTTTGKLTGARISVSRPELIEPALPEGIGIVLGGWDHLTHIVDIDTGAVQPCDAPEEDWRLRQGVLASAQYQAILRAEATQARPLRELLDAMLTGVPALPESITTFNAIKAEIVSAREAYNRILAAQSKADLDALV